MKERTEEKQMDEGWKTKEVNEEINRRLEEVGMKKKKNVD